MAGYIAPVHNMVTGKQELEREQRALAEMKATKRSLTRQLRSLQRDDVIERRARALGAIKPGERAFLIKDPPRDPGATPPG